jgi:hypothetical protein
MADRSPNYFHLMKLTLHQFTEQRTSLRVTSESGNMMWLAPDADAARRLVDRGVSRGQIWTVAEMAQIAEARTIAALLSAAGVVYGDVVAVNE